MQGIVCVNKPQGWTSFDVVKKMKKIFNTSKVGHLGTLDPMAEGVLPVAIGRATKLFDYYLNKTKSYVAEFEFGYQTDTLDAEGDVISSTQAIPTMEQISGALPFLTGRIMQVPPKYSAIKINGRRAYDLARKDIEFELAAKEVNILSFVCSKQLSSTKFEFIIECSAGTYIRSLARDLAQKLGSLATMTKLLRVRSGNFLLENSKLIEEIEENPLDSLISVEEALADLPKLMLPEEKLQLLANGVKLRVKTGTNQGPLVVYAGEKLFGLGEVEMGALKISARLYEGEN